MAVMRDRPYCNSNFLVDFGEGDSRSVTVGFSEVIFPTFTLDAVDWRQGEPMTPQVTERANSTAGNRLVLKRGLTGALNLYEWWNNARHGKEPMRRTMKVELLGEDLSTVVLTWHFHDVYPVSLSYSPLRALEGGIVMVSIELAFETMEMS